MAVCVWGVYRAHLLSPHPSPHLHPSEPSRRSAHCPLHHHPAAAPPPPPPSPAGTLQQVEEVTQGLQRLDFYLTNVTHEQRYLYARTIRHLRTAESTHGRTFGYLLLL